MIRSQDTTVPQTPMMRQYFSAKEKYPRELLFFRMGDFYEMFFDDAKEAAAILGIALTSRSKDKDAIPMAGFPVRAADSYLARLLKAGKRVAICEQVEDPKEATGLVDREVVRVISPGTITNEKLIGEKRHNFILSLAVGKERFGLSWLDVTTGQFLIWETDSETAACAEVSRIEPAECLLPESLLFQLDQHHALSQTLQGIVTTPYPDPRFDLDSASRTLNEHFRTRSLEGFGCAHMTAGLRAGGGLLHYVCDTQKDALHHITKLQSYRSEFHVPIDRATRRALELTETQRGEGQKGTLIHTIDATRTAPGARLLRDWILTPLTDIGEISRRQDAVGELIEAEEVREDLSALLCEVHDLERISTRISYRSANARDLLGLLNTLEIIPRVRSVLEQRESFFLRDVTQNLHAPEDLRETIASAIVDAPPLSTTDGGMIRPGYNQELDELRELAQQGTQWIARFQQQEVQRTGIPSLKVGFNRVFGYYIEVTNTHRERTPEHYVRKQTLKNCERFITAELKEYETKVLSAKEKAVQLEQSLFAELRDRAAGHIPQFQESAQALAEVDVLLSFATTARDRGYVRPLVNDGTGLRIEEGRHPVVEAVPGGEAFVPNSVDLDAAHNIMIITGPNMAGKSTYIRQVAILTLLAQTGSFIPARSAEIGVVDRIFTRVGASDDLTRGQSTFMVEMYETANILNNATKRSLVILDEVGRGTSTFDGVSLAWAISEYIAEHIGARTLFATHYHELTSLAVTCPSVQNFNFSVKEWNDDIIFLRKVVPGGTDKSYGIHVARLAGIPREVLQRAREILSNLESQSLDLDDRPALASRKAPSGSSKEPAGHRQLDLFHDANQDLLKTIKKLDLDRMTPIEALIYLGDLKRKIV